MADKMKRIPDEIRIISLREFNTKYPINGRKLTYEDIFNMYYLLGDSSYMHTLSNVSVTKDDNTSVYGKDYTSMHPLSTDKNHIKYGISKYINNTPVTKLTKNIIYSNNSMDNSYTSNMYNSNIQYDIESFVFVPGLGIYPAIYGTREDPDCVYNWDDELDNDNDRDTSPIVLNTSIPDIIYDYLLRRKVFDNDDVIIISRSGIKYPEFNTSVNNVQVANPSLLDIDYLDGYYTRPPVLNIGPNNDILNKTISTYEKSYLFIKNHETVKHYKYDDMYYTVIRLNYNRVYYGRSLKYDINITLKDDTNYSIPISFIKLSNMIRIDWEYSYILEIENQLLVLQNISVLDISKNNVLPYITPISLGIFPVKTASGIPLTRVTTTYYPSHTNAYHYVFSQDEYNKNKPISKLFLIKKLFTDLDYSINWGIFELNGINRRINKGDFRWDIELLSGTKVRVTYKFTSVLYEFPTLYDILYTAFDNSKSKNDQYVAYSTKLLEPKIKVNKSRQRHEIKCFFNTAAFIKKQDNIDYSTKVTDETLTLKFYSDGAGIYLSPNNILPRDEGYLGNDIFAANITSDTIILKPSLRNEHVSTKIPSISSNRYGFYINYNNGNTILHYNIAGEYTAHQYRPLDSTDIKTFNTLAANTYLHDPNAISMYYPAPGCDDLNHSVYKSDYYFTFLGGYVRPIKGILWTNELQNLIKKQPDDTLLEIPAYTKYYVDPRLTTTIANMTNDIDSQTNNRDIFTFNSVLYRLQDPSPAWLLSMYPFDRYL